MLFYNKCSCFVSMFLGAHIFYKVLRCWISKWFAGGQSKVRLEESLEEIIVLKKGVQESDNLQYSTFTESKSTIAEQALNIEVEKSYMFQDPTFFEANVVIKEEIVDSDILQDSPSLLEAKIVIKKEIQESDILQDPNSSFPEADVIKEEIQESDNLCDHTTIIPEQNVLNIKEIQNKSDILLDSNSTCENTILKQCVLHFKLQDDEESEKLQPTVKPFSIQKVHSNHQLIQDLSRAFNVNYPVDQFLNKPYTLTKLLATSDEYQNVHRHFSKGNDFFFNVEFIFKITNIFLHLHYLLLKAKYKWYYSHIDLGESFMYHGTKQEFLPDICCWNFDKAKVKTHKYGKGISFAKKPFYATFYHIDNKYNFCKVMIMAHVLDGVGPSCIGNSSLVIPPAPSYTSTNKNGSVTVKYEDASFCPTYLISYKGWHPGYKHRVKRNFILSF